MNQILKVKKEKEKKTLNLKEKGGTTWVNLDSWSVPHQICNLWYCILGSIKKFNF